MNPQYPEFQSLWLRSQVSIATARRNHEKRTSRRFLMNREETRSICPPRHIDAIRRSATARGLDSVRIATCATRDADAASIDLQWSQFGTNTCWKDLGSFRPPNKGQNFNFVLLDSDSFPSLCEVPLGRSTMW